MEIAIWYMPRDYSDKFPVSVGGQNVLQSTLNMTYENFLGQVNVERGNINYYLLFIIF